ncbi:MAG: hypothetical protein MUC63_05925, partial [Planctomycetes bacterium]|nr:hypothetical protein [Planctomycetota bacterium]
MTISAFDGNRAFGHLKTLAQEIGPRPAGSEGERQAGRYISEKLKEAGLDVRTDPFPIGRHTQLRAELQALEPSAFRIECAPQLYAADTPEEGVE